MILAVASNAKTFWFVTRGSGVVAQLLLTASVVLGILSTVRWRTARAPRFVVGALHRNLTLFAIAFVAVHMITTVADGYAPIGFKDAVIPFLTSYRPFWLALGAISFDLLLALVATSLLRTRIGLRSWRIVHWLAYVSWPIALMHGFGSGSDARASWYVLVSLACAGAVVAAIVLRVGRAALQPLYRVGVIAVTLAVTVGMGIWYRSGPAKRGWAARSGTPRSILQRKASATLDQIAALRHPLRSEFSGHLNGRVARSSNGNGGLGIAIAANVNGSANGVLRLTLWGWALQSGGLQMTNSTASFQPFGYGAYEGHVTHLDGTRAALRLVNARGDVIRIVCNLWISDDGYLRGTLAGRDLGNES